VHELRTAVPSYATISKRADHAIARFARLQAMANSLIACEGRFSPSRSAWHEAPDGSPRHKLERLRELRAVIETLRGEREAQDPLLAWIVEREKVDNRPRD
jgi:hypothetical protein